MKWSKSEWSWIIHISSISKAYFLHFIMLKLEKKSFRLSLISSNHFHFSFVLLIHFFYTFIRAFVHYTTFPTMMRLMMLQESGCCSKGTLATQKTYLKQRGNRRTQAFFPLYFPYLPCLLYLRQQSCVCAKEEMRKTQLSMLFKSFVTITLCSRLHFILFIFRYIAQAFPL